MKKKNIPFLLFVAITSVIAILAFVYIYTRSNSFDEDVEVVTDMYTVDESDYLDMTDYVAEIPEGELSQEEIDGLILMREEEKLAHDVYTKLYEKWGQNIFNNISDSEQTHTDSVKELLDRYDIEDPVKNIAVGEFTSSDLLDLYTTLVEKGNKSIDDALQVGATVEDLDIKDLEDLMGETDKEDILAVYQNLQKGSRNHLRSFTRVINRNGETYTPVYITQDQYDEIINTPSENGVTYDAQGGEI
jgi:hypothetical protein